MKTELELGDNLGTEEWHSMTMISLHIPVSCEMGSCPIMHVVYLLGRHLQLNVKELFVLITVWGKVAEVLVTWKLGALE